MITDFVHTLGTDFTRVLTYQDSAGELIDLTDYTAKMQVRNGPSGALVLDLTPVIDESLSTITISIAHDAVIPTALLSAEETGYEPLSDGSVLMGKGKKADYSVLIEAPVSGYVTCLLSGSIYFVPNPTKGI